MAAEGTEDHLAWEARQRTAAAIAAVVAGVCIFVGSVWRGLALSDAPQVGFLQSLSRAQESGPIGSLEALRVTTLEFYDSHAADILLSSVLEAIGLVALGWALTYLAVATRARRPELPKFILYLPLIGGVLLAVSRVIASVATNAAVSDFLGGERTVDAADDITQTGLLSFGQVLGLPGMLALAVSLVLVSLNAMRVGLLTRFMGVLGVITGALQVLPLAGPLPVVQCFWLVMLGLLFSGRWPGGSPPAWNTGQAAPWPTSAQLREERARAAAERRGETVEPTPEPEPEPATAGPSPSARKRKRKRR